MSSSQFDDLLGDLGDTTSGPTTKTAPNGDNTELLLDFGGGPQVTNGQVSNNGVNPLYDLDSEDTPTQQPQPPSSSNPLYDLDFNEDTSAPPPSSNPLYEFENASPPATTDPEPASSNPFQDFESLGGGEAPRDSSVDLLSGTDAPSQSVGTADLLGDFNTELQAVDESNTIQEGDSGIQVEHNGSSNLLDDFVGSGVTITTQDQEQPADGVKQEEETMEEEVKTEDGVKEVEQTTEEEMTTEDGVKEEEQIREEEATTDGDVKMDDNTNDDVDDGTSAEALPDLVVKEEGDEVEEGEDVPPSGGESDDVAESQEEAPIAEGARGAEYSADKREEDLEQYCMDREEETSEVSEEAPATDEGAGSVLGSEVDDKQELGVDDDVTKDDDVKEEETIQEEESKDVEGETDSVDGHDEEGYNVPDGMADARDGEGVEVVDEGKGDAVDGRVEEEEAVNQSEQLDEGDQILTQPEVVEEPPRQGEESVAEPVDEVVCASQEDGPTGADVVVTGEPQLSEEQQEVPMDADKVGDQMEQEDAVQPDEHREEDSVVDGAAPGKPDEAEEPLVVTTTTEETPYQAQGLEEFSNTPQESNSGQWPPEDKREEPQVIEETPASYLQEEQVPVKQQEVMSSLENQPQPSQQWEDEEEEEEEEGVYENEPVKRDDVARESDKSEDTNLPSPGLAQNILAKFNTGTASNSTPRSKREITPPNPTMGGGEYVSEPRVVLERYEGKAESGVFESEPQQNPEVVRSDSHLEEALPEQGSAKKFAARYTQIDKEGKTTVMTRKKEVTPDRDTGPTEYVSEPRGFVEHYEGKADSGVFESQPEQMPDVVKSGEKIAQDAVPERGTAKNLAQRFHQISVESASPVASSTGRNKRELTPDQSGQSEYVSEPRAHTETYESKVESGVFENTPQEDLEVVKSQSSTEEYVPERGYAKNVAAKFKELESTAKSPPLSPGRRKEFTPPREDQATSRTSGIYENSPESKPDVVTSSDSQQEVMPGAGTAKSMAQRYKEIEAQSKSPVTSKPKKELTPPPNESGIYENKPEQFQADYNHPAESGIVENTPAAQREDVLKSNEGNTGVELPEAGTARNLVSKWRQIESESAKNTSPGSAGRHKEFTPPREEPRIMQNSKSPRTPKSPMADSSGHQLDNGSVHPSDLPGQYQPQNEPHVFESTPEPHPDASREADTDKSKGLPKKNQAKKMLARFQSIEAEAKKESPKPVSRKQQDSETSTGSSYEPEDDPMEATRLKFEDPDQVGRSKSMKAAIQVEKCGACDKTVYAMERLEMNKRVYHRACFRCSQCKSVLTPKTFAINNEVIFCTTHYKQNFTTKGNYDEGFGRQQHKKHWNSNPNIANSVTASDSTNSADDKS